MPGSRRPDPASALVLRTWAGAVALLVPSTTWAQAPSVDPVGPPAPSGRPVAVEEPGASAFTWRYPTFRPSEYVATGLFGGVAIAGLFIPTTSPRWTSANGLDSGVRDALRLEGSQSRKTADDASDLTLALTLNYAAFDAAGVAWAMREKGSVAYQMATINIEVLAVTAGVSSISKGLIARQRPYAEECRTDPVLRRADDCDSTSVNVGFISGHASLSFAAASVTCMHHAYLGLYESAAADAAACVGAYGAAAATGLLRVLSDKHYATDVVSGAAVGTAIGLGLPWLLHYREELPAASGGSADGVTFSVVPGPTSATVVGSF